MLRSNKNQIDCRNIAADSITVSNFSPQKHTIIKIDEFLTDPEDAVENAILQKFAELTPQYPGIRAAVDKASTDQWLSTLSPLLSDVFGLPHGRWELLAWHSLVTKRPEELAPIQCLPHVDGVDPNQIAMMLYLQNTNHGATAFFRHKSTGFEALTAETFPAYRSQLEQDVAVAGLPPKAYVTDGAPLFERTFATEGKYNQAVFYRGNILHSGIIDNDLPLSSDPRKGRYTINAFLRPPNSR